MENIIWLGPHDLAAECEAKLKKMDANIFSCSNVEWAQEIIGSTSIDLIIPTTTLEK